MHQFLKRSAIYFEKKTRKEKELNRMVFRRSTFNSKFLCLVEKPRTFPFTCIINSLNRLFAVRVNNFIGSEPTAGNFVIFGVITRHLPLDSVSLSFLMDY